MHEQEQPEQPYEAPQVEDVPIAAGTVETAPGQQQPPMSQPPPT